MDWLKYERMLQEIRKRFHQRPALLQKPRSPEWLKIGHPLCAMLNDFELMKEYGRVTWGVVLNPAGQLFQDGSEDYCATVLFSDSPLVDRDPLLLLDVMNEFIACSDSSDGSRYEEIRSAFRVFEETSNYKPVDIRFTDREKFPADVHMVRMVLYRKYLRDHVFRFGFYPILYLPHKPNVATILPMEYLTPEETVRLMTGYREYSWMKKEWSIKTGQGNNRVL